MALIRTPTPAPVSGRVASFTPTPAPTRELQTLAGFLGDSYAAGIGSSVGNRRWTALLSSKRDWGEINGGYGGTGYGTAGQVDGGKSYADRVSAFASRVSNAETSLVIVSGGRSDLSSTEAEVTAGIAQTFTSLRKSLPNSKIIALSPLWDDDNPPERLSKIAEQVRAAVTRVGGQYVDIGQPFTGRLDLIGPDGVHPNDAGYELLAEKIDSELPKNLP
ncbi:SGNH/GDSL hydrolase family protein [Arthrobacter sp. ZGTC131]|uniref:SGNH/GDSL hydrolase family protein n=1 Tax=Arthrobacter sp. ZGTC131 TaxID=2058898 RepID=UPI0021585255|nr:SGNH/GDSL hydrolase family protein [Arthrobacter sp. ZGTC131]